MKLRAILALLATLAAPSIVFAAPRKNVVLFVVDDQGMEAGCYGNPVIKTPNLDQLAAQGTRFTSAFCTTASCSASRAVILSGLQNHANGQYGHQHGYNNFHSFSHVRGLPVLLHESGYRTASVGKYHIQPEANYHFDEYLNKGIPGGARSPVAMAENARDFIAKKDDRPFFLYFCTADPHRAAKGFANDRKYPGVEEVTYDPKDVMVPPFLPDTKEVREELAEYYQAVSRLDQGLGRLMRILKETGHWDDTLILYLSDNGIAFPGAKTTLYEPGMHLPLVVRSPDQKTHGQTTDAMVTWADITPTILDFTGTKGPSYPLHGRSFLSVLDDPHPKGWDEVYGSHTFHEITMYYPMRVIRTRKYKLLFNIAHPLEFPFASDLYESPTWQGVLRRGDTMYGKRTVEAYLHRPRFELYDLQSDPDEIKNLANDPAHAQVLAELQAKLKAWQKKTDDPWLLKYDYE